VVLASASIRTDVFVLVPRRLQLVAAILLASRAARAVLVLVVLLLVLVVLVHVLSTEVILVMLARSRTLELA
jgi:hypothetical protein